MGCILLLLIIDRFNKIVSLKLQSANGTLTTFNLLYCYSMKFYVLVIVKILHLTTFVSVNNFYICYLSISRYVGFHMSKISLKMIFLEPTTHRLSTCVCILI